MSDPNDSFVKDDPELPESFKDPVVSEIGNSVHPKTKESYEKLDIDVPDNPNLAARRPHERLKRQIEFTKKKPVEPEIKINSMYRLKDKKGNEWLCYRYDEKIEDLHGNKRQMDYAKGSHTEVEGEVHKDVNFQPVATKITKFKQVYDLEFSEKEVDRLLKLHEKSGNAIEEIDLNVSFASTSKRSWAAERTYTIKNIEDFKRGTHQQLMELGQRGLSGVEPSLSKLEQPITEDPPNSEFKRGKKG